MVDTEGYVYFAIKTEDESIEEDTISSFLGLRATGFKKMHSKGKVPPCTSWEISTKRTVNPDISSLIREVVSGIMPYKKELVNLKRRYNDIHYILEIVIYHGENAAGFVIENEQITFLSEIGTDIDVDQYNYKD